MLQVQNPATTRPSGTIHPRRWPAGVLLAVGLLITLLTTLAMRAVVETEAQRELTVVGHEIAAKIEARLHAHAAILRSGAAYLTVAAPVSRAQWRAFIEYSQISRNLPGIQGVGFAQWIPAGQLPQHIAAIRAEGFPDYRVWPEGERPVYSAIIYLEPFTGRNLRAFGYDMWTEPVRRAAMAQARDQNVAALSGKVHLVQETDQDIQAGTLMYVPVYRVELPTDTPDQRRAALVGWVYSPYRMNDLLHGILGGWDQNSHHRLRLVIHDGDRSAPETLLYDSQPAAPSSDPSLPGSLQIPIDFNGHRWTLDFTQAHSLAATWADFRVWLVAGSGTLISGLLSLLALAFLRSRAQAGALVEELLAREQAETAQRAAERKYREIFQTSLVGIYQTTPAGRYLEVNPAFAHILGFATPEQLMAEITDIGAQLYVNPQDRVILARRVAEQGQIQGFESQARRRDGQICWVLIDTAVVRDADGAIRLYQGTMLDITERKQIEVALRETHELFSLFIKNSPIYAYIKEVTPTESRVLKASDNFQEMVGIPGSEMVGKTMAELFPAEFAAKMTADDWAVISGGQLLEQDENLNGREYITLKFPIIQGSKKLLAGYTVDITRRKRAEEALRQSEAQFRSYFELPLAGRAIASPSAGWIDVNLPLCAMLGYARTELLQMTWTELTHPDDLAADKAQFERVITGEIDGYALEKRFIHRDGHSVYTHLAVHCLRHPDRSVNYFVVQILDITERKQSEAKLQLAASVFSHAREGILITTPDGTIIDVNDTFTRITGYSRDEVMGHNPRLLSSGLHPQEFFAALWRELVEKGHWYGEIWNRRKGGEVYAEMLNISSVRNAQGQIEKYLGLFSDITALKEHERQLEHIAHYDVLTGLANRVLLADRLQQAMAQAQRRGQCVAVAMLDLDGFKAINDRYGHGTGDQLLITVSARMKQTLREGDTLARMGGDEFVTVLLDLADVEASMPMLVRLLAVAAQPVGIGDLSLQVSVSIGITFYPQTGEVDADQLLRQADQAMYQAKLAGRNGYYAFDAAQDRSIRSHYESLERVRHALVEREFVLHYQPKVNMRTGAVVGAEALIRWRSAENGLLPPAQFMPMIDASGLACAVGHWVISEALRQMSVWAAQGVRLPVSVNIAARHLQQPEFVAELQALLAMHPDVPPEQLELEILETMALTDVAEVSRLIERCRQLGVGFALDDFGTGYSSLTYLKHLAVQVLKIDQSFVRDLLVDADAAAIVQGIIGLSIAFRRGVIAEGVETDAHGSRLLQLGCTYAQGYGIARPMPPEQIPAWIAHWTAPGAWTEQ